MKHSSDMLGCLPGRMYASAIVFHLPDNMFDTLSRINTMLQDQRAHRVRHMNAVGSITRRLTQIMRPSSTVNEEHNRTV